MTRLIIKFLLELFKKDDGNGLGWRLGMRWNHINLELKDNFPRLYNAAIQFLRSTVCKVAGHRWSKFEHVKYGNFGLSRRCSICLMHHNKHNGKNIYMDTHRKGGWTLTEL